MSAAPTPPHRPVNRGVAASGGTAGISAMVAGLPPSCFAFVMATGIVSAALLKSGRPQLAEILFWVALCSLVLLLAATVWRAATASRRFMADAVSPARTFGFFSFVAGLNVVGLHFDMTGRPTAGLALAVVAAVFWVVLNYLIPCVLLLRPHDRPVLADANGSWFLWVVATQSMAAAAASAAAVHHSAGFAVMAAALWSIGVVLYLLVGTLVTLRLITHTIKPEDLSPTYWIFMGATAISVLACSGLLELPDGFPAIAGMRGLLTGAGFILWSIGLWWVPLLVIFGIWRHGVHHHHFRYETALWSIVFPLGMLATSSMAFGTLQGLPVVEAIGQGVVWVAVPAWAIAVVLMLAAGLRWLRGRQGDPGAAAA
ncbi:tellurite resistance/C4-dicarboxylate transporter family protein [Arthrobacter sp.]|uniref:tellurite resistance/C4-dicarboxylate transporter family protein n=1 Tax=Arthrobacter sp. TaxID=1667 RepID=UPI003A8E1720